MYYHWRISLFYIVYGWLVCIGRGISTLLFLFVAMIWLFVMKLDWSGG